jgi:hypothetical protein
VRQHCLHLEEYLHSATEIQHALAEFSDLLKKLEPAKGERA